jgi:hypothetical protein
MIRPTTIPQTLDELMIEQAIAREALRLSFEQHKKFAVSLRGVQQNRTISDTFDQTMSGKTLVDMNDLDMIVGSGGVLSHAPRREQSLRMLVDSFLPEGITEIAVDSIFMMPQLGVLSSIHEQAAIEVFNKDCLIKLGTCISALGNDSEEGETILKYKLQIDTDIIEGNLKYGELILLKYPYKRIKINIITQNNFLLNNENEFEGYVNGGEVGILLDGRGRPFDLSMDTNNRKDLIKKWSEETNEYPN